MFFLLIQITGESVFHSIEDINVNIITGLDVLFNFSLLIFTKYVYVSSTTNNSRLSPFIVK